MTPDQQMGAAQVLDDLIAASGRRWRCGEIDDSPGLFAQIGDRVEFVPCESEEAAQTLRKKLAAFVAAGRQAKQENPNATLTELFEIAASTVMQNWGVR